MEDSILVSSFNRSNVANKLWYAMSMNGLREIDEQNHPAFGDRVYIIPTGAMYIKNNKGKWINIRAEDELSELWTEITNYISGTSENGHFTLNSDGTFTFNQPIAGNFPQSGVVYNNKVKVDGLSIDFTFSPFSTDSPNSYFGITFGDNSFDTFDGTSGTVGNRTAGLKYLGRALGIYIYNYPVGNERYFHICTQYADITGRAGNIKSEISRYSNKAVNTIKFTIVNDELQITVNGERVLSREIIEMPPIDSNGKAYMALTMVNNGEGTNVTGITVKSINENVPNNWAEDYSNWRELNHYLTPGHEMDSCLGNFIVNEDNTFTFNQLTPGWFPQSGATYRRAIPIDGLKITMKGYLFTDNAFGSNFGIFLSQNPVYNFDDGSTNQQTTAGIEHIGNIVGYYFYNNYDDFDGTFYYRMWDPDQTRSKK